MAGQDMKRDAGKKVSCQNEDIQQIISFSPSYQLMETTSRVNGITLKDVYFMKDKKEFVLFLDCDGEECYHEWREICPPPPGARDWHEVLLDREEHLSKK
jgi:hypothetical protein